MGGIPGRVTIAVRVVARRAVCGKFHLARRSHKLPNLGIGNAADCRGRWILRKCAARRGRTSIVVNEINKILGRHVCTNVVRGCDGDARSLFDAHARTISPGTIAGLCESFRPSVQIGMVCGGQAAAFFNIKKNDGLCRKAFLSCGGRSVGRIVSSLLYRCTLVVQVSGFRAAVKQQKTKTL